MKIVGYECISCDHFIFDTRNRDGTTCPKCGGPVAPTPYEPINKTEEQTMIVKPTDIHIPTLSNTIYNRKSIEDKLRYLDGLRHSYGVAVTIEMRIDIADRIQRTCDSIEKDLGLMVTAVHEKGEV